MVDSVIASGINSAWSRLEKFQGQRSKLPMEDWIRCKVDLAHFFASHDGTEVVESNFRIPPDYDYFMGTYGGSYSDGWFGIYSADSIIQNVKYDVELHDEADRSLVYGYWIRVGGRDWKYDDFLCCDRSLPFFGKIVEGDDSHPRSYGDVGDRVDFPSFTDFLRYLHDY